MMLFLHDEEKESRSITVNIFISKLKSMCTVNRSKKEKTEYLVSNT